MGQARDAPAPSVTAAAEGKGHVASTPGVPGNHGEAGPSRFLSLLLPLLLSAVASPLTSPLAAQTFTGRVLEEGTDAPVPVAAVRLLDADDEAVRVVVADSLGRFRLPTDGPGRYRLQVEALGYEDASTPLLEVTDPDGIYPLDLTLRAEPIALQGFEITGEELTRRIRRELGMHPNSLRNPPYGPETIREHAELGRTVADLLHFEGAAGIFLRRLGSDGPCVVVISRRRSRDGGCAPVFLNGAPLPRGFMDSVPLDRVQNIVVILPPPQDPPGGMLSWGVHIFTQGYLR